MNPASLSITGGSHEFTVTVHVRRVIIVLESDRYREIEIDIVRLILKNVK